MKSLCIGVIILLISTVAVAEVSQEPSTFKVNFSITYNVMTLEQAAAKEKEIRERMKDACRVDIRLESADGFVVYNSTGNVLHIGGN